MIGNPAGKRHQVDVMLPSATLDRHGQRTGADTTVLEGIPAEIIQLTGIELVRAQRIWATATYSVRVTLYPNHGLTTKHYLLWGTRKLHVGAIIDENGTQYEVQMLCGEEV